MYSMAAMALDAVGGLAALGSGGKDLRRAPMMKNKEPMPNADIMSDGRRPKVSDIEKMKIDVATTLQIP